MGFWASTSQSQVIPGQCLRQVMDPKGYLTDLNALQVPWVPVGPRGSPWVPVGPRGSPWVPVGPRGSRMAMGAWWAWLVVTGTMEFWMTFQQQLGMEQSSQLTKSIIFQRGRLNHQPAYTCGSARWRNQVQSDADISDIKKARLLRISSLWWEYLGIYWDGVQPMKVILPKVSSKH